MPSLARAYTQGVLLLHYVRDKTKASVERIADARALHRLHDHWDRIKYQAMERFTRTDFSHIYRKKTACELIRLSAAVMGIEFCYAAETAFVSPILLNLGLDHMYMTLIWCLSPLIGFFLTPLLGSLSDQCRSPFGRRRLFILLLSVGIILGLLFVPNGEDIGQLLGDPSDDNANADPILISNKNESLYAVQEDFLRLIPKTSVPNTEISEETETLSPNDTNLSLNISGESQIPQERQSFHATWGLVITILGTVLLDFDSDACQSPARTYLLDVVIAEDRARGLSMFTVMAGLGGSLGYALGGIDWDSTFIGDIFGGHVRAVFTLILFIFIICILVTVLSFQEIPLDILNAMASEEQKNKEYTVIMSHADKNGETSKKPKDYGSMAKEPSSNDISSGDIIKLTRTSSEKDNLSGNTNHEEACIIDHPHTERLTIHEEAEKITLRHYLSSIMHMPKSLRILCLTNLFSWMSLVCYSLYFTDFVGEAVFGGDPQAAPGTSSYELYTEGVRFGCWGMALYSFSCSVYSFFIDKLIQIFRAKPVYVCSQLIYTIGMVFMAIWQNRICVIIFSCSAGVMYSTLFTMPYLLVAQYHANHMFSNNQEHNDRVRGMGTDVAVVGSMVFLAQFLLSAFMGSIIAGVHNTVAIVVAAAILSFCGAVTATQVTYLDL